MTKQEFNNRYRNLDNKMNNVKTHVSKNKYIKLMLELSNEYRLSNNLKLLYK